MVMPIGPMRLECKNCGRRQWNAGRSDAIQIIPCECGGLDFEIAKTHVPRRLWPLLRMAIRIAPKR